MTFVPLKLTNGNGSRVWGRCQDRFNTLVCIESKNWITGLNGATHCLSLPHILLPRLLYFSRPSSKFSDLSSVSWVTLKSPKSSPVFPSLIIHPAQHPWRGPSQEPGNHGFIQCPIACGSNSKAFSLIFTLIQLSFPLSSALCFSTPARANTLPDLVQDLFIAIFVFVACPYLGHLPVFSPLKLWEML